MRTQIEMRRETPSDDSQQGNTTRPTHLTITNYPAKFPSGWRSQRDLSMKSSLYIYVPGNIRPLWLSGRSPSVCSYKGLYTSLHYGSIAYVFLCTFTTGTPHSALAQSSLIWMLYRQYMVQTFFAFPVPTPCVDKYLVRPNLRLQTNNIHT